MSHGTLSPLFDWRSAIASKYGPSKPSTRHVLLTLSLWMSAKGDSCFPSQETLAEATGMTRKSVRTHIQVAEEEGWLERNAHGFGGQRWRRYDYAAKVPLAVLRAIRDEEQPASEPPVKGGVRFTQPSKQGGVNGVQKVGYDLPTSTPLDSASSSTEERMSKNDLFGETVPQVPVVNAEDFSALWAVHPKGNKKDARAQFAKAIREKRATPDRMLSALRVYVSSFDNGFRGMHLFRWIRDDRWEEVEDGGVKPAQSEEVSQLLEDARRIKANGDRAAAAR